MLLSLNKKDITNAALELSKVTSGAKKAEFTKIHQVIQNVFDTGILSLKVEPNNKEKEAWDIVCFGNGKYAGDWVTRRSISEFVLHVLGVSFL